MTWRWDENSLELQQEKLLTQLFATTPAAHRPPLSACHFRARFSRRGEDRMRRHAFWWKEENRSALTVALLYKTKEKDSSLQKGTMGRSLGFLLLFLSGLGLSGKKPLWSSYQVSFTYSDYEWMNVVLPAHGSEIIQGQRVPDGEMLYMASVQDAQGQHICGGFLIGRDVVVTAAHCDKKWAA